MGDIQPPQPAILICGLLAASDDALAGVSDALSGALGTIDLVSPTFSFGDTSYYRAELGTSIRRQFISFAGLYPTDTLAATKRRTNALELHISRTLYHDGDRRVNIDPGYIHLGALVLATTKPRAHRISIGGGIFAEVTLMYESGGWQPLPWTYPDYAGPAYHTFFSQVRDRLKSLRRQPTGQGPHAVHPTQ